MKKILLVSLIFITTCFNAYAEKKCSELPGFKKVGKNSVEYIECLAKKTKKGLISGKLKLNTDSKLTDWIKKKLDK